MMESIKAQHAKLDSATRQYIRCAGLELQAIRRRLGLPQNTVAALAHTTSPTLSFVERGKSPQVELATILRLLLVYGVSSGDFFAAVERRVEAGEGRE